MKFQKIDSTTYALLNNGKPVVRVMRKSNSKTHPWVIIRKNGTKVCRRTGDDGDFHDDFDFYNAKLIAAEVFHDALIKRAA